MDPLSCPVVRLMPGLPSRRFSRRPLLKFRATPALIGWVSLALATTSRWCTMVCIHSFIFALVHTISFQGIEYGDMQLIAEAYDILKRGLGLPEGEIADIFEKWNKGVLDSFLIEITYNILRFKDDDGEPLVTKILDQAGQKGTGKWTAVNALDTGVPGMTPSLRRFSVKLTNTFSHTYRRGRLFPHVVRLKGRAEPCQQGHCWP